MSLKDHFSSEGTISNYIISCLDFLLHFVFFVCFFKTGSCYISPANLKHSV